MDPGMSQARKEQAWANQGRQEAKYLRFLRTKDKESNYKTLKIIGKGAFGEVKLVQKKVDGRVARQDGDVQERSAGPRSC